MSDVDNNPVDGRDGTDTSDALATAPRLPGVYRAGRARRSGRLRRDGRRTAGGRRPQGLRGRLAVYASGKALTEGARSRDFVERSALTSLDRKCLDYFAGRDLATRCRPSRSVKSRKKSGVSTPTVRRIVRSLIEEGSLFESGVRGSGAGRRAKLYELAAVDSHEAP